MTSVQRSEKSSAAPVLAGGTTGHGGQLRPLIRDIPDYPKPGILFKDITPLLGDAAGFALATRLMAEPFADSRVTHAITQAREAPALLIELPQVGPPPRQIDRHRVGEPEDP